MQGFRSSINMQFDLSNQELLHRYVLTPSHCEVLLGVMDGVTRGGAHAHLLIGPYGTGKSLLATIVCQFLSRQFSQEWQAQLLTQAERMDTQLATRLHEFSDNTPIFVPVIINGRTGSLRRIINQAIYRTLHQADIMVATLNEANTILNVVQRWKHAYPDTYKRFLLHISEKGLTKAEWSARISNFQESTTKDFISFYPTVTSGTPWTVEHDVYFVDHLEQLSKELAAKGIGLFIVFDEFGRFLQSLEKNDATYNMQDLQDLAEFVNRTENIHLLVVGHKHIRQYAVSERENIRGEFEKVEKRFRYYSLETDASTFLRLAQEAIAPTNSRCWDNRIELEQLDRIRRFPLFTEFTSYQLEHGIIRMLYPLHPVAVMLLPQLSNIFGQNERTLYSFLTDDERYSLLDHVNKKDGYYYADHLFHFFDISSAPDSDHPSLQLYNMIEPYLDESAHQIYRRVVQLLTLWTVTRLTQKQPLTLDFLSFALGTTQEETEYALNALTQAKIVRYNAIRNIWEIFDGSSIDVSAVVAEKMSYASLGTREIIKLLEQHLPFKYVVPYEYNDEMDMHRYADICFIEAKALKSASSQTRRADDSIWFVLYNNEDEMEAPEGVMNEIDEPLLVAFPKFTLEKVRSSLVQYKIISGLLNDSDFLAQDTRVKNELNYMLNDTSINIKAFVGHYFTFEDLDWRLGTQRLNIKNLRKVEDVVTERLRNTYRDTPIIRNEAFNRNRISAIQRRALIDVIDRVIHQPTEENLGITGYGPNYLIYASVLKNNGYVYDSDNGVHCTGNLAVIREELCSKLDTQPIGKLSSLIRMMEEPPYGIRAPVIPLLLVALLRDRWEQLLFYAHDMLITQLSGASVLELVELSESYEYRYYIWTAEERTQLQELGRCFALPSELCTTFIQTAGALLRWLRSLPKYAQITNRVSPETQHIRDWIRSSETDPYIYMKRLASSSNILTTVKNELESFMIHNGDELEQHVLRLAGLTSLSELFSVPEKLRREAIGKNSKILTLTDDNNGQNLLDQLVEHLVGVSRTEWSDATHDLFINQFEFEWQLLHVNGELAAATNSDVTVDLNENVQLSKKSQTLYANVKNLVKYAGKDIPNQEIRQLLVKILQEI